ncbi:hypothetical protein [Mycolicibacterium sarraceniae]|uniref:Alanine and proline rich membrane protein n=1 Tax=Mycolicibacterium sarraceniae TaxID=1534348 RepID=A0A7I7SSV1_9MYCO|nr:hypothetical protein [Mycolicibacterium sarraceniae]BBY58886.1 hypothetical protein MSAR_20220 [Mycolicibacterium sarraceniae]
MIIAVVVAVIAIGVAIGAWFRPMPKPEAPTARTYSDQEVADAKKAVCDAYGKAINALTVNSQQPDSPNEALAVVANSRVAIHVASTYLATVLAQQLAAPEEVATPMKALANQYQSMILDQIGNSDRSTLDADYRAADSLTPKISQACK